jgi:phosphohistidine swiveling domain-containing protein
MTALAESTDGGTMLTQIDQFIETYGYLSPVGTDIAVATWHENPAPVRELLAQFVLHPPPPKAPSKATVTANGNGKTALAQRRFDLKGRVNTLYNRLLAELRWTVLALENHGLKQGWLQQPGDIFFLTLDDLKSILLEAHPPSRDQVQGRVMARQEQFKQDQKMAPIPYLVFGNDPPSLDRMLTAPSAQSLQQLSGIGASAGVVEGPIRVMTQLESLEPGSGAFILVVPYTDAGWAPLLARAQGLIAEVGGRLSHGAILAREYGIPAVMDVANVTQRLHTGQWVRLNGQSGLVELIEPPSP